MEALFDTIGDIRADRVPHSCTGLACSFCAYLDGLEAKKHHAPQNIDKAWHRAANHWRISKQQGDTFTADDLLKAIGYPAGTPNQIGAIFRTWQDLGVIRKQGQKASTRESNHHRRVYLWEVTR